MMEFLEFMVGDISSSSSSESFSSDSEMEDILAEELVDREVLRNREYFERTVEQYEANDFFGHFRVTRLLACELSERYARSTFYDSTRGKNGNVAPLKQVCIFLWFAGHEGAGFADVADRFDVTLSTTFRVVERVTDFLNSISHDVIRWPNDAEKRDIATDFANLGFDNVIGAIDGTHIRIDRPKVDCDAYYNRKKYFSIQLQVTCDHQKRFTSIYCGFPGSVHDARVYRRSPLSHQLREKCGDYILLGDSAYPSSRNLMTPFKDTGRLTRRHHRFNAKLSHTRVIVEHSIGLLKNKFRQLYHIKFRRTKFIPLFVKACCVLHNLAVGDTFPEMDSAQEIPVNPMEGDEDIVELDEEPERGEGVAYRDYLLNTLFPL